MERGDTINVVAMVNLAGLEPNETSVELYHGALSSQGELVDAERNEMTPVGKKGDQWEYRITVTCKLTGQHGYSARILPKHAALASPYVPGLVRWA
jgi:starch phosphorylase